MSISLDNNKEIDLYYYSLIFVIIGELLIYFIRFPGLPGAFLKILIHSHIYFAIFFLIFKFQFKSFNNFNSKKLIILLFFLTAVSLFQLLRPSPVNTELYVINPFYARFGNIWYGPMFLIPIFLIWATYNNSIYWFEKISFGLIKIGIIIFGLSLILNFEVPYIFFISSFCLLAGYSYSKPSRKIWILLGLLVSVIIFFINDYRSGIIRILLSLLCVFVVSLELKIFKKILIILFFVGPVYISYNTLFVEPNIFQLLSEYNTSNRNMLFMDTRTILFKETYFELKKAKSLFLGLGSMGNYFSEYFSNIITNNPNAHADFYIRSKVEVGFLQMLLKGGFIYIFFITLIYIYLLTKLKNINNSYLEKLSLISLSNFFFLSIENLPAFNYLNAVIWIILGMSICFTFQKKNNTEIKEIFKFLN